MKVESYCHKLPDVNLSTSGFNMHGRERLLASLVFLYTHPTVL